MLKEWLVVVTENAVVAIDWMALVIILIGTVEAFITGLRLLLSSPDGHERRDIWLRYARWLVAGLTFQLAADIIETSITTNWEAVGRLAAVARTELARLAPTRAVGELRALIEGVKLDPRSGGCVMLRDRRRCAAQDWPLGVWSWHGQSVGKS